MVHCPECRTSLDTEADIVFEEVDSKLGFVEASKRFYTASCAECGANIGSGVAGARANANAGAT